ncbi:MAG: DUF302 domain-containing protein [Candidatus Bathyarchaeota archaeon]|nr:DUF302 domain-containing protein [Candidatus Bathyarchaeota archaeon]
MSKTVQNAYSFSKVVSMGYEKAIAHVSEEMKKEGFGVLTKVDVRETLKKKIDVEFRPYTILGACNPHHAYQALQKEMELGLMLPCNIIVYVNDNAQTVVSAIDPVASMQAVDNPELGETAMEIRGKLKRVIDNL